MKTGRIYHFNSIKWYILLLWILVLKHLLNYGLNVLFILNIKKKNSTIYIFSITNSIDIENSNSGILGGTTIGVYIIILLVYYLVIKHRKGKDGFLSFRYCTFLSRSKYQLQNICIGDRGANFVNSLIFDSYLKNIFEYTSPLLKILTTMKLGFC